MIRVVNGRQKVVILLATLLIISTGLYPPWVRMGVMGPSLDIEYERYQYDWLFHPPGITGIEDPDVEVAYATKLHIDVRRLLVQWAMIAVAALGMVKTIGQKR